MAENFRPSRRAERVWTRLTQWYGKRFTEQYGDHATPDWCMAVDDATNDAVKLALSECRNKHTSFPPTLPEFEQLLQRATKPAASSGPSATDRLTNYVIRNKPLTEAQLRMPWKYLAELFDAPDATGKMVANFGLRITGVVVPADGDKPGYRVMLADTALEQLPAPAQSRPGSVVSAVSELANSDWGRMPTAEGWR